MNYWHMQLHPDNEDWKREEELLEHLGLIGLGYTNEKQVDDFKKRLKPLDIVLIKRGSNPIALVEVSIDDELEDIFQNDGSRLDWFRFRRKVNVLDYYKESKLNQEDKPIKDFPSPRGTLKIALDKNTKTYQYISKWHKSLNPKYYENKNSFKIEKIQIKKHKIFNDFNIDLKTDEKIMPIIVLAGINGSGKSTLLNYIEHFHKYIKENDRSSITLNYYDKEFNSFQSKSLRFNNIYEVKQNEKIESFIYKSFKEKIVYFETSTDIEELKSFLLKYIERTLYKENIKASEIFEKIQKFMNEIFHNLDLNIEFHSRDDEGNIFFKNKKDEVFSIDDISTGEKILVSKVFYLYLKEIKNKIVLIDEPELSLHPSWQNKILGIYEQFAKEYNCQIILATHSPHIIGSAKNEYIRVLNINENTKEIEVINNLKAHGRDINSILFDVMGEVLYRPNEFRKKIDRLYYAIEEEQNYELSLNLLKELENDYGEMDSTIIEAKLLIEMMEKNEK